MQRCRATRCRLCAWGALATVTLAAVTCAAPWQPLGATPNCCCPPSAHWMPRLNITLRMTDRALRARRDQTLSRHGPDRNDTLSAERDGSGWGGYTVPVAPSPIVAPRGTDVAGPGAAHRSTFSRHIAAHRDTASAAPAGTARLQGRASPLAPPPAPLPATGPEPAAAPVRDGTEPPRAIRLDLVPIRPDVPVAVFAHSSAPSALYMQADSVVQTPQGQVHTLTGKIDDPAKPLADYHETSPGSGIWVGGPGTEPRFQPPGRLIVTPDGKVHKPMLREAVLEIASIRTPSTLLNAANARSTAITHGYSAAIQRYLPRMPRIAGQQGSQIDYASRQLA